MIDNIESGSFVSPSSAEGQVTVPTDSVKIGKQIVERIDIGVEVAPVTSESTPADVMRQFDEWKKSFPSYTGNREA